MKEEGMTLIEVLIAVTIGGIILGAIFSFLDLGFSTLERSEKENQWEQEWRVLGSLLEEDLQNLFICPLYKKSNFSANYKQFRFQTLIEGNLNEVTYSFDYNKEELLRRINNSKEKDEVKELRFFSSHKVNSIKFNFYDEKVGYWKEEWSYKLEKRLPTAVKLIVYDSELQLPPLVINIYLERKY